MISYEYRELYKNKVEFLDGYIIFMKKNSFLIFILFIFITSAFTASAQQASNKAVDKIVVIVNDSVITQSEVSDALVAAKKQITTMNMPMPPEKKLKAQIINNLIDQELQRQLVKLAKINISEREVDDAINNIAKRNNLTIAKLQKELAASGVNVAKYRAQIREQIAFTYIRQHEVNGNITISDQDINQFLKEYKKSINQKNTSVQYHLKNILISLSENTSTEDIQKAQKQAAELVAKIRNGEDFDNISKDDAIQSSDLGWRKLTDIPPIFVEVVKNMKVGEVSEPIQAPNGFHILKLVEIHSAAPRIDANNKEEIRAIIYQRKFEAKVHEWLEKLRESAYIKFVD